MVALVLDASVAISAVLDEAKSEEAREILRRVAEAGALVPNLWHLEVGQTLLVAQWQTRITAMDHARAQRLLLDLPISVDTETWTRGMRVTTELAGDQRLSVYDAGYLELSRRCELPFATFDDALRRAAAAVGVSLL